MPLFEKRTRHGGEREHNVMTFTTSLTFLNQLSLFLILLISHTSLVVVDSTREQCQKDCQATGCPLTYTNATRLLGPTRPFHWSGSLEKPTSLTRPYPFAMAAEEATILTIHINLDVRTLDNHNLFPDKLLDYLTDHEKSCITNTISLSVLSFQCVKVNIQAKTATENNTKNTQNILKIPISVEVQLRYHGSEVQSHGKDSNTTLVAINEWFNYNLVPSITSHLNSNGTTDQHLKECLNSNKNMDQQSTRITGVTFPIINDEFNRYSITLYNYARSLAAPLQNPYNRFCQVGCSLFYANTTATTVTTIARARATSLKLPTDSEAAPIISLQGCMTLCDKMYSYNLTVGYSDLMEVARLECHDGCYVGLKRCQPGYYCTQPSRNVTTGCESSNGNCTFILEQGIIRSEQQIVTAVWNDGTMISCPPGTYRETSYQSIGKCLYCPPGRYRSEYMGTELSSCTKCPAGTYAPNFHSTSILDCIRCPAGRFTTGEGSGVCTCITSMACTKNQLQSPADAAKSDTIPFIGLW